MTTTWPGLAREKVDSMASHYEMACLIAANRASDLSGGDPDEFASIMVVLRRGIRIAVAEELLVLGCPHSELGEWGAMIVNRAAQNRIAQPFSGEDRVQ